MSQISVFLMAAITSGTVAGIITTIGNILIAITQSRQEIHLEAKKYSYSINNYRYCELHKYLKIVLDHSTEECNKRYQILYSNYQRAKPLFDSDLDKLLTGRIPAGNNYEERFVQVAESIFIGIVQKQIQRLVLYTK